MTKPPSEPPQDDEPIQKIQVRRRRHQNKTMAQPLALRTLAVNVREQGDLSSAHELLARALCLNPGNARLLGDYGVTLAREGQLEDALKVLDQAIKRDPLDTGAQLQRGQVLHQLGRFDDAVKAFSAVLSRQAANSTARLWLGRSLRGLGKTARAARAFKVATRQDPRNFEALVELGCTRAEQGDRSSALRCFHRALRLRSRDPVLHMLLGWLQMEDGDLDQAARSFRQSLWSDAQQLDSGGGLARVLERRGDPAAALETLAPYTTAERATARIATCYARSALVLGRSTEALPLVEALLGQPRTVADKADLSFVQGELLHDMGENAAALAAWQEGNRLLGTRFDSAQHRIRVDAIIANFEPELFRRRLPPSTSDRPVFVVGLPRSGIGLWETVLGVHSDVHPGGARPEMGRLARRMPVQLGLTYPECVRYLNRLQPQQISARYLGNALRLAGSARRVLAANPFNAEHLGLIALLFPRARVISVRRAPRDTCLSCFRTPYREAHTGFTGDLTALLDYHDEHTRLMAHWRRVLPLPTLEVSYERLVTDSEEALREALHFLELPWDPAVLSHHAQPENYATPRRAAHNAALHQRSIGQWRAYTPWFEAARAE